MLRSRKSGKSRSRCQTFYLRLRNPASTYLNFRNSKIAHCGDSCVVASPP